LDHGEKVGGELVVAGGDTAEVLQLGEEALDEVALAVEPLAEAGFPAPVALGRDVGRCALILDQLSDAVGMARVAEAWDRSTAPGATSRSTISSASVRLQRLRLACRSDARLIPILATRHGRARPGHACLWTDILNPL